MSKPAVLFYCQPSDGMGQLVRCVALGTSLSEHFHVVILSSGPTPRQMDIPESVDVVQLPPLGMDLDSNVVSLEDKQAVGESLKVRRDFILDTFIGLKPRVLIIELFPFGQTILKKELLPLIEYARNGNGNGTLILCSLRDILVGNRQGQRRQDDKTAGVLEKYFDAVIVHSDPLFARLEESFQPQDVMSTPVYYSGFVARGVLTQSVAPKKEERLLVSAGSGLVGMPLFRAAIEAHRLLWAAERLPMTIVAGPLLPEKDWLNLQELAANLPSLELKRAVPDLACELAKVHWSVSQCGYNTATETLVSGTAALFVPYSRGQKIEQIDRAQRLTYWSASRLLMQHHLNGASLANEIHQLVKFKPRSPNFNMAGADNSATLINQMVNSDGAAGIVHGAGNLA